MSYNNRKIKNHVILSLSLSLSLSNLHLQIVTCYLTDNYIWDLFQIKTFRLHIYPA